jgi:hypothetical protein
MRRRQLDARLVHVGSGSNAAEVGTHWGVTSGTYTANGIIAAAASVAPSGPPPRLRTCAYERRPAPTCFPWAGMTGPEAW